MLFSFRKFFVAVFTTIFITACEHNDDTSQTIQIRNKVVGQLVDINTLAPVSTATVTLWTDDQIPQSSQLNEGAFSFDDIPNGSHRLEISSQGYATISSFIHVDSENDNDNQLFLGDIGLTPEAQLTILVSDENGAPVTGGQASVMAVRASERCSTNNTFTTLHSETTYTANIENGKATFTGLNQCEAYKVIIPSLDVDRDGTFDFETFVTGIDYYNDSWGIDVSMFQGPLQIVLSELTDSAPLSVIHVSGGVDFIQDLNGYSKTIRYKHKHDELNITLSRSLDKNEEIKFFFSSPVDELEPVSANYKYVYDTTTISNPAAGIASGATISFNPEKTIMTVSPPDGGYAENQTLSLEGTLIPAGNPPGKAQELIINQQAFITSNAATEIVIAAYNNKLTIVSSRWLEALQYTITTDTDSETRYSYNDSDLSKIESQGCTICSDNIVLNIVDSQYSWILSNLSPGDQFTLSIQAKTIDNSDTIRITKTFTAI